MTSIDAVEFTDAWEQRVETILDGISIAILSLRHLKLNKQAINRDTDQIHLARLEKYGRPAN